jgi:hypothetical protein
MDLVNATIQKGRHPQKVHLNRLKLFQEKKKRGVITWKYTKLSLQMVPGKKLDIQDYLFPSARDKDNP